MINLLISGANGRMGKKVKELSKLFPEIKAVCGVDICEDFTNNDFPIYNSFDTIKENVDVIIDFSAPATLPKILNFIKGKKIGAVLCSTGYTKEDIENINLASKENALFRSANMSLGANVLIELAKAGAKALYGFDIEIIEKHHNQKVDAPSGTALMIADGIKSVNNEKVYTYGREGIVGKRNENEIGIHAIRGGNIVGEHQVIFAGVDETITLTHQATDRGVFASGALKAATFLADKKNGLYNMADILK